MQNFDLPLNDYEVYEQIGAGGGGAVYRAYHKNLKKQVVIKKAHVTTTDEAKKRAEVDILKNLHHPYLPQVFNYYDINGISYTVMDYIEGRSFGDMLKKGEKFSEKQVIKYATQLCEAVAYLHSRKIPIIHGDIKPDNVMLTADDNICLIDFNISGLSDDGTAATMGYTPGYGAPEQLKQFEEIKKKLSGQLKEKEKTEAKTADNDKTELYNTEMAGEATELYIEDGEESKIGKQIYLGSSQNSENVQNRETPKIYIDKRSDVYSIGATIFHLYTGKSLAKTKGSIELGSKSSDGLIHILNKALKTNPDERYQNAGEMLNSLKSVYKHDKRYRRISRLQTILSVFFIAMMAGGVFLLLHGKQKTDDARIAKYNDFVLEMQEQVTLGDEQSFEAVYNDATELMPGRIEAYREKANMLYSQGKYEETIKYINSIKDEVVADNCETEPASVAVIYHIYGNCFFELGDYDNAVNAFETAVKYDDTNSDYYVEYSIALVRTNRVEKAEEVLAKAEEKNAEDYLVLLTKGEIAMARGKYNEAIGCFEECISTTDDAYTLSRAYIMTGRAYASLADEDEDNRKEYTDKRIETLQEGSSKAERVYKPMLLEELAQAAIDAASIYQDEGYEQVAIDALTEITGEGWASFTTYNNLVVLKQRIGEFDSAKQDIDAMTDLYPDDYRVYKRAAFLEIAIQNDKSNEARDYGAFRDNYLKAQELYDNLPENQRTDMEMIQLKQAYRDAVDGGWF